MHQLREGTRIGPYEILAPIGAGGMGEVYRARDTRLDRQVAVKILPSSLSSNGAMRERFEREAKAVSALSHPNICTLYDVGSHDGVEYLVMEYLEGESLGERLTRGPLPLQQVLKVGIEIADALDRAHRAGIVHRDLKPGNVMLTRSGAKLLDFGLAKHVPGAIDPGTLLTEKLTEQRPLTEEGTILGTFQYMAPEQVEGAQVDARGDIFALGAVLYEMATGKRAFEGKTRASVIAAILERDPAPVSTLAPASPRLLDRAIRICLAKDPDDRWQTARDVRHALEGIAESLSQAEAPAGHGRRRISRWKIATAALALSLAGALGWIAFAGRERPARTLRASIVPPEGTPFFLDFEGTGAVTVSPDGEWMTFALRPSGEREVLHLRNLRSGETRLVQGAEGAMYPFWSPDSRSLAFFTDSKLKRVDLNGGPTVVVCDAPVARGGSWGPDGTILFTPHWRAEPIYKVPASGGTPVAVTKVDEAKGHTTHRFPWFLPDGKHFLYLAASHTADTASELNEIRIASLDSGKDELLLRARSNAIYVPGYILFVRERFLLAQRFDARSRRLEGDPVRLAEGVRYNSGFFHGTFSASNEGTLVFGTGEAEAPFQMVAVDRKGNELRKIGEPMSFEVFRVSPDGRKIVYNSGDPSDLWIHDLELDVRTRLTSAPLNEYTGMFSPDGSLVTYISDQIANGTQVRVIRTDGSGEDRLLWADRKTLYVADWSNDGKFLLLGHDQSRDPEGDVDVWVLPMTENPTPRPFLRSQFQIDGADLSPDGKWVSFTSDETGTREVYVTPFPGPGPRRRISTRGERIGYAVWVAGGRELLYVDRERWVQSVAVEGDRFSAPRPLYQLPENVREIDVLPDGKTVIEVRRISQGASDPLTLVANWTGLVPR